MRELSLPYEDKEEAFRRMVFNVMGSNCDDHTKNFAFRLRKGRPWELAPAYDVTFAHNPKSEWTHQHLMSVNGKFKDFTQDDLLAEAERFAVGTAPKVIDEVRAAIQEWPSFAQQAGLSSRQTKAITDQLIFLRWRRCAKAVTLREERNHPVSDATRGRHDGREFAA